MIAIREDWKAGLLGREHWLRNIVSGVIVGVLAPPLAMAFAIASGVKPEQGIYTAIVGGLLVSLFGGSRLQIAGPIGAFIVILASVTAKYGVDALQIAKMIAGAILLLFGITALGALIKFIPDPVIVGFTACIGVPKMGLPEITLPQIIELIGPAIAMLGAIESLLSPTGWPTPSMIPIRS